MNSRYREGNVDFEVDDTTDNDAQLPLPSWLIFDVHYEYAPATPGDRVTPGEAADVNVLDVNLKHVSVFDGCWQRAYREPTVEERSRAYEWLFTQVRRNTAEYRRLRDEVINEEEQP